MSKRVWAGVLMGLLAVGAAGQDAKDGENLLRDAVLKKRVFLRGFSADPIVRWRWDGSSLVQETPKLHTFGVLIADSVKVTGDKVVIQGERHTLLRSSDTAFALSATNDKARVEIDLTGADVANILPKLAGLVFYPDSQSALAATKHRPGDMNPKCCSRKTPQDRKSCDCANPSLAMCGTDEPALGMAGMKNPSLLSSVEPEFSDEARRQQFNGNVQVSVTVDTDGKPTDIWIVRPLGLGLDARAAVAVSQYKFKPATCHGQAVPVPLYIDVNFHIF
jgi:TonB family protein